MYINLGYLRGQVRLRNPEIVNNNDNIGSLLKHHRLKLKLTLEDGAEGICSISYLSKIENSLIRPNQKYILQLEEKYNTNLQTFGTTHNELLHQLIKNLFYQVHEFVQPNLLDDDSYQTKLNAFGYFISQNNFKEAKNKYFDLNIYIKNLNNLELGFFLYLTSKLLSYEGRIHEAFSIISIQTDVSQNVYLNTLMRMEKLYLATKMNHHPYIGLEYEVLLNTLIENEFYHKVHDIKFHYLSYLVQFICEAKLKELLSKSKNIQARQFVYLQAKFYYVNMQYDMAYDLIKDQAQDDIGTYELTLMALNKMNQKSILINKLKAYTPNGNKHFQLIVKYLKIKCKNKMNIEELTKFIQTEVLKINDLPDDMDQLNFWYEEGYQSFKKIGYYKDATALGHLIYRKTNNLTMIFE